ncbi:MAG: NAD-glutamate dehydrogenase [Ilumatobacteraceae bacterium]
MRVAGPGDRQTRFVGLLATNAYRVSVADIPGFGPAALAALALDEHTMHSHLGRATRTVLENLPRNLVLEQDPVTVARLVTDIVGLQERQLVRVFEVPEPVGRWVTVLVYLPRSRFTAELPERIADVVAEAYGAEQRTFESFVAASSLARIAVSVRRPDGASAADPDVLERVIDELSTSWDDRLREALVNEVGEAPGRVLYDRIGAHAPAAYRAAVPPGRATGDVQRIGALLKGGRDMATAVAHDVDAPEREWRFRIFRRGSPAALSELLPLLDHLGLEALDEQSYRFRTGDHRVYLYDIGVRVPAGVELDPRRWSDLQAGFESVISGELESDGFNRLVLAAGLTAREVAVVRAYGKYLRQIGFAFSQSYIESTLHSHPALVADLMALFHARFDPTRPSGEERDAAQQEVRQRVLDALDGIPSLDDDRICRMFLQLIEATVRTNYYRDRPAVACKLDPRAIAELPQPRPRHEIWVCGPRVEGVHLRGGAVARGGLRWSDRREDFRTEVLGLMKAQMVKNAVIVPTGAKGGFVVKRPPAEPDALRTEVVECYRLFIRGLLDLTDNLVGEQENVVAHPPDTVVHDGDDTYFVVAADKGTATFSDVANEISAEYGFWLGDAFASGGSAGYDHKEMGITARGAWESVRRHARGLGKDANTDPLTVVGIGDMSGDVFGNGMLRSRHLKLVAAFDHRHVFIDPSPDPEVSFVERQRLFDLSRSTWADYDPALISTGGGVFPRTQKSITLGAEARAVLGVPDQPLTPNELVSAVLTAPVDLLWNGGIGTYVKSGLETNVDVGDRANDGVRVDGKELRARIVAEGGNLGLTQLGRVEYALAGGLVNTDAIDNSAGVDCSDHEVNIKILLDAVVANGELTMKQRNDLLGSMTDEVAQLVLDNNKAQTLALLIARRQALPMVNVHARYIEVLENEGWMDRDLEFLPSDKELAERQAAGNGLTSPEFAVLIAYTKNANVAEVTRSDLPDADVLIDDLVAYFPTALRERYAEQIQRHPLRRQIIATRVVNQMVNQSGISFDHRVTEDTGASVVDVTRSWVAARQIFDFGGLWAEIDELDELAVDVQLELFLDARRMVERGVLWLLRHRRPPIDIAAAVTKFRPGITRLATDLGPVLVGRMQAAVHSGEASRLAAGVPEGLAERAGVWPLLHTGFDVVEVADSHGRDVVDVARVQWGVFDRLDLSWLWDGIGTLPRSDRGQTQARSALRDDLLTALAELTAVVVETTDGDVDRWLELNQRAVARAGAMFTEIRRAEGYDLTTLSVALRQLRNLAR